MYNNDRIKNIPHNTSRKVTHEMSVEFSLTTRTKAQYYVR